MTPTSQQECRGILESKCIDFDICNVSFMVSNFVSFFAPFLLILQLNQDKIGCKSEAKRNKKEEAEYESGRY